MLDDVEREDDLPLLLLPADDAERPLDFAPPFAEPDFAEPAFPLLFLPDEEVFAFEAVALLPPELAFDLEALVVLDLLLPDRLPPLPLPDGTIVSAAAPTAPTAAPVAAPASMSLATSNTFPTIAFDVDLRDRDEVERLLVELPRLDLLAICFLLK